jgi:opine dehydrogenase
MRVTVLGAGAGGASAVVELVRAGHEVVLWNRSPETLEPFLRAGGVEYEGVLGEGIACPRLITSEIALALEGCEAVVCVLPTFLHSEIARVLAAAELPVQVPVVLNPGHTGGALEFRNTFASVRGECPPLAEFSTLTYVARKYTPQRVTVSGRARRVRVAALPGGERALATACELFPCAHPERDVLATGLANVNMVLHPPGAVLGAAWIEARGGDYTFYVEGMTPGVVRVMRALDEERCAVAAAFGHALPDLIEEMRRIGTVESEVRETRDFGAEIAHGRANSHIKAPNSLDHRYYREDFGHGLLPFTVLAQIAGVAVPVADSLLRLGERMVGANYHETGRTAEAMGIAGMNRERLMALVGQ